VAELFEVLLIDGDRTWHIGSVADEETETDLILRDQGKLLLFGSRPGLEHYAQENGLDLTDALPDEIDLDLGGWLTTGSPEPELSDVFALWELLYDDPVASKALGGEVLGEAYDDLIEEPPSWYAEHGSIARKALAEAVSKVRSSTRVV
jgi:hypothetical protein